MVALAVAATFALPGSAFAVDPPTILSAGIDAADRPYVTWRVGAGTTFDHADFATAPEADPEAADSFMDGNMVAFGCIDAPDVCTGTPQSTSLTVEYPLPRDRRYFVKVAATIDGTERHLIVSAVWVIDERKPLIAGQPPQLPEGPPTNTPAVGRRLPGSMPVTVTPFGPPDLSAPPGLPIAAASQPGAALSVLALPKTIGALLARGVRLRVTCTRAPCTTTASLTLGRVRLASRRLRSPRAGTRTLVLKPTAAARRSLRGRARARLRVSAAATPQPGPPKRLSRYFVVRGSLGT